VEKNNLSYGQLAEGLGGFSRTAVLNWVREGMPQDSLEAAAAWLDARAAGKKAAKASKLKPMPPIEATEKTEVDVAAAAEGKKGWTMETRIKNAAVTEKMWTKNLHAAYQRGDTEEAARASRELDRATKLGTRLRAEEVALRERTDFYLRPQPLIQLFAAAMEEPIQFLRSMPDAWAARLEGRTAAGAKAQLEALRGDLVQSFMRTVERLREEAEQRAVSDDE